MEELPSLLCSGSGIDEKIKALVELKRWDTCNLVRHFEQLWDIFTQILHDAEAPTALRWEVLNAATSLLRVCTTQEMLMSFFSTFSFRVKDAYENALNRMAQSFGDNTMIVVPDPQDLLATLDEQRRCVTFFALCTAALAANAPNHHNLAMSIFLNQLFSILNPGIIQASNIIPKLSGAGIESQDAMVLTRETSNLLSEALELLYHSISNYLKMFPAPSKTAQPCDDPELLYVMQQMVSIGEKCSKNPKVQAVVWKLFKDLFSAQSHRIQSRALLGKVVTMCISKVHSAWNTAISLAPREGLGMIPKDQEKNFESKIKATRFLTAVMGILCRSYAELFIPHFDKLASLLLLVPSSLENGPYEASTLVSCARKGFDTIYKTMCGCIKTLFFSITLNEDQKSKLLGQFSIPPRSEDRLSFPKLQVLLYLCQNLPSSILFPRAVSLLYWIMNAVEMNCAAVLESGLESIMIPTSAFIFALSQRSPQMFQDVESFLFQHLFHPHFLCAYLAAELHCFVLRNADEMLQKRHGQLLIDLIKTGGKGVVDPLVPLFGFLLQAMKAPIKEFLLKELTRDLLSGQPDSVQSEEEVLYSLSALLPAWTALDAGRKSWESLTFNTIGYLTKIAHFCVRQFASQSVLPSRLLSLAKCLASLVACERLPERDTIARSLLDPLGDLLRNVTENPAKYHTSALLPSLIDLSVLIPAFSPDLLPNFLQGYAHMISMFPSTKPAVAQLLAHCNVKLRADMQDRLLRTCASLFQQLLADGDWTVCAQTMQSFQHFAQFMPYPVESIQGLLSSECRALLIHYLGGRPFILTKNQQPMSDAELSKSIASTLGNYSKEQFARAQALLLGGDCASEKKLVERVMSLLGQTTAILSTMPPSALSPHAPQISTRITQLGQLLVLPAPGDYSKNESV